MQIQWLSLATLNICKAEWPCPRLAVRFQAQLALPSWKPGEMG